jgi:hypothetical protein
MKKLQALLFALTAAGGTAAWAIPYARWERGYDAVGGEWLLIIIVFVWVYKLARHKREITWALDVTNFINKRQLGK